MIACEVGQDLLPELLSLRVLFSSDLDAGLLASLSFGVGLGHLLRAIAMLAALGRPLGLQLLRAASRLGAAVDEQEALEAGTVRLQPVELAVAALQILDLLGAGTHGLDQALRDSGQLPMGLISAPVAILDQRALDLPAL